MVHTVIFHPKAWAQTLLVLSIAASCYSCGMPTSLIEKQIAQYWEDQCNQAEPCTVGLADLAGRLTSADWDRAVVIPQTSTQEESFQALGDVHFDFEEFARKIVLLKGRQIVYLEQTPSDIERLVHGEVVFGSADAPVGVQAYSRETDFRVSKVRLDSDNGYYFELLPTR